MYKIGIIGDRESVLGFMALGYTVHEAADAETAGEILRRIARRGEYAVIFITEQYAAALEEEIARYKDDPLPAIVSVPGASGSAGYGMRAIKSAVERAVGADILFKE